MRFRISHATTVADICSSGKSPGNLPICQENALIASPIDITALRRENLRGSLYMVLAMAAFALEDMFVKTAASTLPTSELLLLFGCGGLLVFGIAALLWGERLFSAEALSPIMRLRFVFETLARLFYVLALALTPLSAATAILQATPIVVAMGAAAFFMERVGWSRWAAIILGLSGVLIVLRPAAEGFSALSILTLLGMLGFAARDLASRASPASLGSPVLGFYGYLAIVAAGITYLPLEGRRFVVPDATSSLALVAAIIFGTAAYIALMKAMRTGEISVVTPFRYTRLLFGLALGMTAFGEVLDLATIVGSVIVVLAGLFTLWTGRSKQSPAKLTRR
jgi:drug/metabolite transporter (DMT)-like permease